MMVKIPVIVIVMSIWGVVSVSGKVRVKRQQRSPDQLFDDYYDNQIRPIRQGGQRSANGQQYELPRNLQQPGEPKFLVAPPHSSFRQFQGGNGNGMCSCPCSSPGSLPQPRQTQNQQNQNQQDNSGGGARLAQQQFQDDPLNSGQALKSNSFYLYYIIAISFLILINN